MRGHITGQRHMLAPQTMLPCESMLTPQNANSAFLGFTTCKTKPTAPEKLMDPKAKENFFLKEIMVCVEWGVSPEWQMKKSSVASSL